MPLHYTKSGRLDMRYNSSHAAVASSAHSSGGYRSSSSRPYSSPSPSSYSQVVYKKDGTPDMRYNSSRAAAAATTTAASNSPAVSRTPARPATCNTHALHRKKDGTLDMRYKSSRDYVARTGGTQPNRNNLGSSGGTNASLHYKKDGTLDMRFHTSKQMAALQANGHPRELRRKYTKKLCADQDFVRMACMARQHWNAMQLQVSASEDITVAAINSSAPISSTRADNGTATTASTSTDSWATISCADNSTASTAQQLGVDVPVIDFATLGALEGKELGAGAFGVVLAGTLPSGVQVAVKKLHIGSVGKKASAKESFLQELKLMARLGQHKNVIQLLGYCESPLALVLEFAELGSLGHVLHMEEDKTIEYQMSVGVLKKMIAWQIADGLRALHGAGVVHRDVKSENVLLTKSYTPKLCDFGLAQLRGATLSSMNSQALKEAGAANAVGTMAYMAPELLAFDKDANESTDVYSYGILLNELVTMEQPYSHVAHKFVGRGDDAPARYAATGERPLLVEEQEVSAEVAELISLCWHAEPQKRPTFAAIVTSFATNKKLVFHDLWEKDNEPQPQVPASTIQQVTESFANLNLES